MQILGLLGMHFDAVVVEVKTFLLLFRLALAILCRKKLSTFEILFSWQNRSFLLTENQRTLLRSQCR